MIEEWEMYLRPKKKEFRDPVHGDIEFDQFEQDICKRRSKSAPGGGLIVRHRGYTYPFHNRPSNIFSAHFL